MTFAASVLAAVSIILALWPSPGAVRVATILRSPAGTPRRPHRPIDASAGAQEGGAGVEGGDGRDGVLASRRGRAVAALCAGAGALALVGGGAAGVVLGAVFGTAAWFGIGRLEPRWKSRDRERMVSMIPLAADLVAAALTAGCPPAVAVDAVGAAIGGPLGRALLEVTAASGVGADPERAWAGLSAEPAVRPLARALVGAMSRGTSPGPALKRAAGDARDAARWAGEARARSLGARAAAPLGLCFLPAFVLLGIVPIVATSGVMPP